VGAEGRRRAGRSEAELLKERGTPGGGAETDAFNQIEKSALELQAADKTLSREAAISKALEAKPELFSQYRAELAQKGGI
jgi:hypothetical protein